ncbi:HNH endonuclease signature motif containing protein [Microbacterium sp. SS28]|uniref:HNH endonuclease signature motif containing protein n=1 Tax=Microbacterium sp. SS28 TaxID=2919948 RepID=UPI001FAAB5BB|nr:HNH endonuclease signature motif containing protein [Microbacterium sp. SS28]
MSRGAPEETGVAVGYEFEASGPAPGVWRELDTLVDEVQHARAAVAAAQAHEAALLARAVDLVEARTVERRTQGVRFGNDLPLREVSAELGTAMRVGDRTVQRRIDDAHTLVTRFSATFDAWRAGRIDRQHVTTIVDEGVVLTEDAARREYETLTLAVAEVESAGRMREIARVIAARIDPEASARRRTAALRSRDVRVLDLDDGMARLLADLPAPLAYAIMDRLTEFARSVADAEGAGLDRGPDAARPVAAEHDTDAAVNADDEASASRTLGEIRADVLSDLLLTSVPTGHGGTDGSALTGIRGAIQVTIPIETAAGVSEEPALLSGYGPVDADLVRRLMAATPAWTRVLVDGQTGAPVAVHCYRPSAELRRFLNVRDERCRFPGCTMKPWRCDADHTIDAALGGVTAECNLAHLCRRHHVLKHVSFWRVEQVGGRLIWTSPTGRVYTDHMPATLRFIPSAEAPRRGAVRGHGRTSERAPALASSHVPDDDPPPF